jgi:putative ABC transport system permease protein
MKALWRKLELLLRRDRFRSELDEEMSFHRAQAEERFEADGMSVPEARYAAKRAFGNEMLMRERSHAAIGFRIETIGQDVRYALRQMRRAPGFTAAIVATLALGIGANTAIFSVVEATLLRALPYPNADRIVNINDERVQGVSTGGLVTVPRYFDLKARSRTFESVAGFYFEKPTLVAGNGLPQQVNAVRATSDFWPVLGIPAMLGRIYNAEDDRQGAPEVVVLSYAAWQHYLGADTDVIGKVVEIDRKPMTVIGVMPKEFHYPSRNAGTDLWIPTHLNLKDWKSYRGEGVRFMRIAARVRQETTVGVAESEMDAINAQLASEYPQTDGPWRLLGESLKDQFYGNLRPALAVLLAASAALLLIACLNVGNLLLSRATARGHEVAVRRALGASRGRLARQWLTESLLLALVGGGIGLGSAYLLLRFAAIRLPASVALDGVTVNWPVGGFAFVVSLAAGVLFGLAPVLDRNLGKIDFELKSGSTRTASHGRNGTRRAFIGAQVGLSLVLLATSSLLTKSLWKLMHAPLGFAPDHVATFKLQLPWQTSAIATDRFFAEIQNGLEALPGIVAVGQINQMPTEDWHARLPFDVDWRPRTEKKDAVTAEVRNMDGNYLEAMEIPLKAGRPLRTGEVNAVLVNDEFVRRFLPGGNIVGRHMVGGDTVQIVGVIGNVRGTSGSISGEIEPEVYYPATGVVVRSFAVRTAMDPAQLSMAIQKVVHGIDPQQAAGSIRTMDAMVNADTAQPWLNMALMASFAVIALALACVGIYGVVAYAVAQRRREIGVRMALGATRGQISGMFLRQTLSAAMIGMVCGGVATLAAARLIRSQLFGVAPNDLTTLGVAVILLLVPVLLASLRPALQAATVDPAEALRAE